MECIGSKLQKQGVLILLSLVLINTGCEEKADNPVPDSLKGTPVNVDLSFGFNDEIDGASLCSQTDTTDGNDEAFSIQLVSGQSTRTGLDDMNTSKPDKLYNLEIWQFDRSGNKIGGQALASEITVDSKLTVTLAANDDCQLLVVVRGKSGDIPTLSNSNYKTLTDIYAITKEALTSNINKCTSSIAGMVNMPYYLFLEHVKVVQETGSSNGTIQSTDGSERYDVRLQLKRLAVQLKVDWELGAELKSKGYILKEVKLCQVPADYRILQQTEQTETWGKVYPISVANFIDYYRLKETPETSSDETLATADGTKTVWMPANARGTNSLVAGEKYRSKEYAEPAATYLEFVVYNRDGSERIYFRTYLGSNKTTDFNLFENTNYYWKVVLNKINYNDSRIQALTQTPVESTNLQPTSNCIMMKPGTDICFNPYKHEAGTNGWNTYLTNNNGTIQNNKQITNVKVLWQTKDAGTAGELVIGYSVSKDSHVNLVSLNGGNNAETTRINVKVPVTKGGNAVIAAYNSKGTIIWSWHLWISDYIPVPLSNNFTDRISAIEAAQNATQNGMVHTYDGISWINPNGSFYKCVIMDRNLGAVKGGLQGNVMDWVRSFGLLYQGGRKDPIFGTPDGGTNEARTIYDGSGNVLSLNKKTGTKPTLDQTIQNPLTFYGSPDNRWNGDAAKTIYDPCPKGWRIPSNEYLNNAASGGVIPISNFKYQTGDSKASLCAGFGRKENDYVCEGVDSIKNSDNIMYYNGSEFISLMNSANQFTGSQGAGYLYFGGSGENKEKWTNKSAFFPAVVLREMNGEFRQNSFNKLFIWSSSTNKNGSMHMYEIQDFRLNFQHTNYSGFGFSVRCIQDNIRNRSYSDYANE